MNSYDVVRSLSSSYEVYESESYAWRHGGPLFFFVANIYAYAFIVLLTASFSVQLCLA